MEKLFTNPQLTPFIVGAVVLILSGLVVAVLARLLGSYQQAGRSTTFKPPLAPTLLIGFIWSSITICSLVVIFLNLFVW